MSTARVTTVRLSLVDQWRADAATLRRRGATDLARLLDGCAEELEVWFQRQEAKTLSLSEAAEVSGYSTAHLRRMVQEGKLHDVATDGPIRVRRGDLPRKPGSSGGTQACVLHEGTLA